MTLEDFDDHQLSLMGMSILSKNHLCVSQTIYVDMHSCISQGKEAVSFEDIPVLKFLLQPDANI